MKTPPKRKNFKIGVGETFSLASFLLLNSLIFIAGRKRPQCCDTDWYQSEAKLIEGLGIFPRGLSTWLSPEHNYLYGLTINLFNNLGFFGRSAITTFQFILLMSASLYIFIETSKHDIGMKRFSRATLGILVLFLNINFVVYGLTEGVASSLLLIFFFLILNYTLFKPNRTWGFPLVIAVSFLASATLDCSNSMRA